MCLGLDKYMVSSCSSNKFVWLDGQKQGYNSCVISQRKSIRWTKPVMLNRQENVKLTAEKSQVHLLQHSQFHSYKISLRVRQMPHMERFNYFLL